MLLVAALVLQGLTNMFQQITGDKITIEKLEDGFFSVLVENKEMTIKYHKTKFVLNVEAYHADDKEKTLYTFLVKE